MSLLQAVSLGALQGATEFLPISSSAHLLLLPWFAGWPDQGLAFDVALHMGTLAAVAAYFWKDWLRLAAELRKPDGLLWKLAGATVPAAAAGLLLGDWIEARARAPWLCAANLAAFGALMGAADRLGRRERGLAELDWTAALAVGCAQALALFPGVSRSGATLTAALALGLRREDAARFSFLLAAPVTLGAGLVKLRDLPGSALDASFFWGVAASAAVGGAAIHFLLRHLRSRTLLPFVWYRLGLAALIAVLLARG